MAYPFGTGPWGTGAYGITTALTIEAAYAISTHEAVVVLSKPPRNIIAALPGDVRNVNSWQFTVSPDPNTLLVLEVAEIRPYRPPLEWVVRCGVAFPSTNSTVRITATSLLDASGAITGQPNFADFSGVTEAAIATPSAKAASRGTSSRDLANRPTITVGDSTTDISGALVVNGGDYQLVTGAELARKLIIRRLTTTPGEFFHLPTYGIGLKVKQPLPAGDLIQLRTAIQKQLLLEPDIEAVQATVTQSQNVLTVQVRARLAKSGQDVSVGFRSNIGQ